MDFGITESCAVRLRKALAVRNMTQAELCSKAKISKSTLSEYLSGRYEPKQDRIFILAKALDVDPVWLCGYDVPMEKKEEKPAETKSSPSEPQQLTEGDREILEVFRLIPEEWRQVFLEQGRAFAKSLKKD